MKDYARMLVDHHTMANNELATLMRSKGLAPPAALPADKQAKLARLSALSGPAFDREYTRVAGIEDHTADVALFEQGSRTLADRDLKAWAGKTLPTLRAHLQHAQGIAGTLAG